MGLGEIARRYRWLAARTDRRAAQTRARRSRDETERRVVLRAGRTQTPPASLRSRRDEGARNTLEPLADIDVAERTALQHPRQTSDRGGLAPEPRQRMLEQRHRFGGAKLVSAAPRTRSRNAPGTVRAIATPAESSIERPKPLSRAATRRARTRSGVTSAAVLPGTSTHDLRIERDGLGLVMGVRRHDQADTIQRVGETGAAVGASSSFPDSAAIGLSLGRAQRFAHEMEPRPRASVGHAPGT